MVGNLPVKIITNDAAFCDFFENFDLFFLFLIFRLDIHDKLSYTVDIVSEYYTAKCFDEDETKGLFEVRGCDIPKSNCKHNVSTPIVSPNILFVPLGTLYIFLSHPIMQGVDTGHGS